ncbi:serine phosphatase RsbU (regulator of sigma subunit) [Motilibacter peucedani]|uniref:Serine phosphatase RsbU (Regulator of sigma subunit) n=1 Tax=Motilibacter peucedani TaxID=598650 RepID=A0A420XSK1_9ACTN|nr:SpoIIE family protein phosphatase [Motilibacter peucedani]RKS77872.1 serine phosphatase RsbU (regulator of sigma subunit) [Motilibacter peucedani]
MTTTDEAARLKALADYVDLEAPAAPELEAVVRLAAAVSGAPMATVNLIDEHLQRQLVTHGFPREDCSREDSMCFTTLRIGRFVNTADASQDARFASGPFVDGRLGQVRGYAAAPLETPEGHLLGTLCAFGPEPRELDQAQAAALQDLAQVVVALFDRERQARAAAQLTARVEQARYTAEASRALQETLLPQQVSGTDRVVVATRYMPGTDGAEVGGDWYDVVRTPDSVVLVIGDVQGHSSRAAALMGQVRTAVRAYVSEGHSPDAALERTNALMVALGTELFATCALVALDEATGWVTAASAGHPEPLALRSDGRVGALEVEPGPPLGVAPDAAFPASRHRFTTRTRLVLYTDGVVESRRSDADGAALLEARLRRSGAAGPEEVADALVGPVAAGLSDDAALLVVDYAGVPSQVKEAHLELAPDMRSVGEARDYLRTTLDAWEIPQDVEDSAELIVSELVTNALLHTGAPAVLVLRYDTGGELLALGVEDTSTRHPQPRELSDDSLTGRGMFIVEALAERWWVAPAGDGKTVWADLAVV